MFFLCTVKRESRSLALPSGTILNKSPSSTWTVSLACWGHVTEPGLLGHRL